MMVGLGDRMPQEHGGSAAVAGEEDIVIIGDSDGRCCEGNNTAGVAKLPHGDEGKLL
jgi:hypothetical protein